MKEISISPHKYIYDLSYASQFCVAVETKDYIQGDFEFPRSNADIQFFCYNGGYLLCLDQRYIVFNNEKTVKIASPVPYESKDWITYPKHQTNGFIPHGMTKCKSGHLLFCLWNHKPREKSQGKVWKLNTVNQKISEYEYDKSRPLFKCPTYITENGNGDICVSDEGAVVVLDEVGMLRFRYKGLAEDRNFDPYGICTDSSRKIIITDMKNDKIHMIDENGGFICYIQYENMEMPRALCVGQDNTLYVGEWKSGLIKVISLA